MTHTESAILIERDVECLLRDGVVLRANVYRPKGRSNLPALVMRLPYGKDIWPFPPGVPQRAVPTPQQLAAAGYIVVVQDVRGRYRSDGIFAPVDQEEQDGYDVTEWASVLPGSNGQVGMFGPSYLAQVQWAAALVAAPALASIIPQVSPAHSNRDGLIVRGGANELSRLGWAFGAIAENALARDDGLDAAGRLLRLEAMRLRFEDESIYSDRPFASLETDISFLSQAIQAWGVPRSDLTGVAGITDGRYSEIDIPAFLIGGWYDVFLGSTLKQYEGMLHAFRTGQIRHEPHLVVGPWSHLEAGSLLGDIDFGPAAAAADMGDDLPLDLQHQRWFDATLKNEKAVLAHVDPVRLFVMGENRWRSFSSYPPPATPEQWYFSEGEHLTRDQPQPGHASYAYDPLDPVPTVGGATLLLGKSAGPRDQTTIQKRTDVLSFVSEELTQSLTVIGAISVTLFASSTAVDTDFVARLCDDAPEGVSINLTDGILRASERRSHDATGSLRPLLPEPITPHRIVEYVIDLWSTAHTFLPGHRIRLDVTSSNFPRWDPNLKTGASSWTSATAEIAQQTITWGGSHLSRVTLPIVSRAEGSNHKEVPPPMN